MPYLGERETMKRKVCAAMALFGLFAATAAAEDVYKCVGSDGRLSYQARPCAQGQVQSTVSIRKAPPAPAPLPQAKGTASQEQIQSSLDFMKRSAPPAAPPAAQAPAVPKSYKCTADNGAVFYQHNECPSLITIGQSDKLRYVTKVKGVEITREEACSQIYKVTASAREGSEHDDRVSTYDKNLHGDSNCR